MAVCVPPAFEIGFFEFSAISCDPGLGCDIFHPLLLSVARLWKLVNFIPLLLCPSHSSCSEPTAWRKSCHFS